MDTQTDPRAAALKIVGRQAVTAISPRVEGILFAFECSVACELRTARDRAHWPYGQAVWDEIYGPYTPIMSQARR
jgi:hypothetical protein